MNEFKQMNKLATLSCYRYSGGQLRPVQQLQPVPHEDHQLGGDHHRPRRQVRLRLQLYRAGARVPQVPRLLQRRLLGRRTGELPEILQDQLQPPVPSGPVFRAQAARVLPSLLRWRLHRA